MKIKQYIVAGLVSFALFMPMSANAATDDGTCRSVAKREGISYSGAVELNLAGCVYSSTRGYYVPRSGSCNERARNVAKAYPYPRSWEIARRISKYCTADARGIYTVR